MFSPMTFGILMINLHRINKKQFLLNHQAKHSKQQNNCIVTILGHHKVKLELSFHFSRHLLLDYSLFTASP